MKVYVFYYIDRDGEASADRIFKTEQAAIAYQKKHPKGAFGSTWYKEVDLDLNNDLMLVLSEEY